MFTLVYNFCCNVHTILILICFAFSYIYLLIRFLSVLNVVFLSLTYVCCTACSSPLMYVCAISVFDPQTVDSAHEQTSILNK